MEDLSRAPPCPRLPTSPDSGHFGLSARAAIGMASLFEQAAAELIGEAAHSIVLVPDGRGEALVQAPDGRGDVLAQAPVTLRQYLRDVGGPSRRQILLPALALKPDVASCLGADLLRARVEEASLTLPCSQGAHSQPRTL